MKESTRIARFAIIGTFNALITALVVWVMMDVIAVNYLISNVVAYLVAQIHNFVWSKYWIFPTNKKSSILQQVLLFSIVFGLAYGAQFIFLLILVEKIGCNEYLSQFFGLFVYGGINFMLNKKVTFR